MGFSVSRVTSAKSAREAVEGMTTGKDDVARLIEDLESSDETVRRRALFQLAKVLDPRAIPAVERIAAHDTSSSAQFIARKLLALYDEKRPDSRPQIGSPEVDKRAPVVAPGDSLSILVERISSADSTPALISLLRQLGQIGDAAAVPVLKEYLALSTPDVRIACIHSLGEIGTLDALEAVVPVLGDHDPAVVVAAILALKDHKRAAILRAVRQLAGHAVAGHRRAAVRVIDELADRTLVPLAERLVQDPDSSVAQAARDVVHSLKVEHRTDKRPFFERPLPS